MLVTDAVATALTKLGAPRHAETTRSGVIREHWPRRGFALHRVVFIPDCLSSDSTLAHASALYDPPVPRAGLLHAVGSSRRCGVEMDLESGELPIPERPHVCLMIDKRAAGVPNRCLGVHQGYHLVVLGDELSWLERSELD